jgi:hypothetical protein
MHIAAARARTHTHKFHFPSASLFLCAIINAHTRLSVLRLAFQHRIFSSLQRLCVLCVSAGVGAALLN